MSRPRKTNTFHELNKKDAERGKKEKEREMKLEKEKERQKKQDEEEAKLDGKPCASCEEAKKLETAAELAQRAADSAKEAAVMVWGGLRGAVSLSLALLVDGNHLIGDRAREMIFLQTTGIVALTLIINGTTSGMVYKALQVYPPNPFKPVLATQSLGT